MYDIKLGTLRTEYDTLNATLGDNTPSSVKVEMSRYITRRVCQGDSIELWTPNANDVERYHEKLINLIRDNAEGYLRIGFSARLNGSWGEIIATTHVDCTGDVRRYDVRISSHT